MKENCQKSTTPLTTTAVNKALREGKPAVLKDTGSLVLKVTGQNKGSWIFRGRLAGTGKVVEIVCGNAPDVSLAAARTQRDKVRIQLREGINPNDEKRARLAAEHAQAVVDARTFGVVAEEYFALRQDLAPGRAKAERGRVRNHMGDIVNLPVVNIERLMHLKPLIDKLVLRGDYEQARRVGSLIDRIMNYALDAGYIKVSPADHLIRLVPRQARGTQKHLAAVTNEKDAAALFKRLWAHIDSGRSSAYSNAALKLSCYVPVRNGNMIAAQWDHIDLTKGEWHFPETKNGHAYIMPVTRQMRAILEDLLRYKHNKWCFPSGSKYGHITNGGLSKILRQAGIPRDEHCLHGFRSTFETIALNHGMPKALCERLLFHVAGGMVEQAYNRANYNKVLPAALQWWNDTVDALRMGESVPELPSDLRELYR